jgi:hypothetical protein
MGFDYSLSYLTNGFEDAIYKAHIDLDFETDKIGSHYIKVIFCTKES